jgi:putative CocE/NonD family hydrolase
MHKWSRAALLLVIAANPTFASAPYPLPAAAIDDPKVLDAYMPTLVSQLLADMPDTSPDDRFRLLMAGGRDAEAAGVLDELLQSRAGSSSPQERANDVPYAVLLHAKLKAASGTPFATAYAQSFREVFARLDDRASAMAIRAIHIDVGSLSEGFKDRIQGFKGKPSLQASAAMSLVRGYQIDRAYAAMMPVVEASIDEDDARRYVIERNIRIPTPGGGTVCAMVFRQRSVVGREPALLDFTIYNEPRDLTSEARRTASNGYAGVMGLVRGKGCSPDSPVPFEHDGVDAAATIDWIARQPWSDGRVGMYGGSYDGFAQWAAAKHMPKALKALMPSVGTDPGIDDPMEGNVGWTFGYDKIFYTTNNKTLDDAEANDFPRWQRMLRTWYTSGAAFRSLDKIDGTPNPIFDRWLDHPSYDAYWQAMTPQRDEFAKIDIPVLTTTGYYDPGQVSALYYFIQHHAYRAAAEHYLLIGPYDHFLAQTGTVAPMGNDRHVVQGYTLDPVARIDLGVIRYQWFDYVFKRGPKPDLLKDTVNYQVMGSNTWRHAPTLAAMADRRLRLYFDGDKTDAFYPLNAKTPTVAKSVPLEVNLADRSDVDRQSPATGDIVDTRLDTYNGLAFASAPMVEPAEFNGLFSGRLDFVVNKRDFDVTIDLYELTSGGEYIHLSNYIARASYVADRSKRHLLVSGKPEHLDIAAGRLTSRLLAKGSRLVVLIAVPKGTSSQINYGSGKPVSDETIVDSGEPLHIAFSNRSYIDVPLR